MTHRHWPLLVTTGTVIFFTAILAVFIGGSIPSPTSRSHSPQSTNVPTVTVQQYEQTVSNLIVKYQSDGDAKAVYNALSVIRVPKESLSVHIDLVLAFGKLITGSPEEGQARLDALKAANSWLPL